MTGMPATAVFRARHAVAVKSRVGMGVIDMLEFQARMPDTMGLLQLLL